MNKPGTSSATGLRIHDLVGLVVGYGMAALLARSLWSESRPLEFVPLVALILAYGWLGLAMSGPLLLLLDRRGGPRPPAVPKTRRPRRPGFLISDPVPTPVGRGPLVVAEEEPPRYTRAEVAWIVIGGYWLAMMLFVVPAMSFDTPWPVLGFLQLMAAACVALTLAGRKGRPALKHAWTHSAATILLWTWPIAWTCLILLSRSL